MKQLKITLFGILLIALAVYADAVIIEFSGEPSQDKIILTWKTSEENDIDLFIVERSANNRDFKKIGEVTPRGNNSEYQYIDGNLAGLKNVYYYRLRVRNQDGTSQVTESITVMLKISSFAKTWGSIKALFQ